MICGCKFTFQKSCIFLSLLPFFAIVCWGRNKFTVFGVGSTMVILTRGTPLTEFFEYHMLIGSLLWGVIPALTLIAT
uniref:Uncharacterized protein n=1 Tax=Parascaris equorum TaxID=6256 RepID=A0A914R111_PAREQ